MPISLDPHIISSPPNLHRFDVSVMSKDQDGYRSRIMATEAGKTVRVWLDDIRKMPDDFDIHVSTQAEAIALIATGTVVKISLDHDLGDEAVTGNGYGVACYIEEGAYRNTVGRIAWAIHSANSVGRQNMGRALANAERFWEQHER